jgi:Fe-S cluster assembly protein SufD
MANVQAIEDIYLEQFTRLEKARREQGWWALPVRREAIARFVDLGFPTTEDEDWKYTSVEPIKERSFIPALYEVDSLDAGRINIPDLTGPTGVRVVFVNGRFVPRLSSPHQSAQDIFIGSLAAVIHTDPHRVEPYLAKYADYQKHVFIALNTAFMEDGAFVHIPEGRILPEPVHLVFIATVQADATLCHPRNLIVLDPGSQATILETYLGLGEGVYFTNAVTEMIIGESAVGRHYKMQMEHHDAFHIATLQVHLLRDSDFASHMLSIGGALARNDLNVMLEGEGANASLNGLYVASGMQHMDHHTLIDHIKPHGTSRELYKGILAGKSRGVFDGKIVVHPNAQKTDARQVNKNLLFSENAWVNTKPQLEIHADDVKCTHGSSVGPPEQDWMFYLRARGLDRRAATILLATAFAGEVIGQIPLETYRTYLEDLLASKIESNQTAEGAK